MAINSARLVVDPVTENTRAKLRETLLVSTFARPPDPEVYNDPVNGVVSVSQIPQRKGEMRLFRDTENDRNILMVVVEFITPGLAPNDLIWKEVRTTWYYADNLTGEEFRAL
jgi:hypothetical protein